MLAALPLAVEVDADTPLVPFFLEPCLLAPLQLGKLVNGLLEVLGAGDHVEFQATKHMDVAFNPMLSQGDGRVGYYDDPVLRALLGWDLSFVGHLVDAAA